MGANNGQTARELYSGLRFLLEERGLSIAALAQLIADRGERVDGRTLQRLADPDRPLKHIDTRVLDAVCRTLETDLGSLLIFAPALSPDLRRLSAERQQRLDTLLDAHSEGELSSDELHELEILVAAVDDLDFANTRRLVEHRARVRAAIRPCEHSAAD